MFREGDIERRPNRRLLQAHVSPQEGQWADGLAEELGLTVAAVLRRGLRQQRRIRDLKSSNLAIQATSVEGNTCFVPLRDVIELLEIL